MWVSPESSPRWSRGADPRPLEAALRDSAPGETAPLSAVAGGQEFRGRKTSLRFGNYESISRPIARACVDPPTGRLPPYGQDQRRQ